MTVKEFCEVFIKVPETKIAVIDVAQIEARLLEPVEEWRLSEQVPESVGNEEVLSANLDENRIIIGINSWRKAE